MLSKLFEVEPFSLGKKEKEELIFPVFNDLVKYHLTNCDEFKSIITKIWTNSNWNRIEEIPFLPVRLFKDYELKSVSGDNISRAVTSSGTTGQKVSKVFLDKETSFNQVRALTSIIRSFIGKARLPLLILDTENIKKDPKLFPVRGAGLMSFSMFAKNIVYALDKDMNLNLPLLEEFFAKNKDQSVLMTGYTYIIWEYIIKVLEQKGKKFDFQQAWLFHGGGWKKLKDQALSEKEFSYRVKELLGNTKSINYYGMAEQLGSIFTNCEYGHMHCSIFSDIIVRDPYDFKVLQNGNRGLLQVLSVLPKSYPGFSILTEDEGEILGEDDCPCGKKGKYFKIHGRVKNAELRGCGDTYERR